MRNINLTFFFPFTTLLLLVVALSFQILNMPPLGKFLNPLIGSIQNDQDFDLDRLNFQIENLSLRDSVEVFFDERKVPHIYASNLDDLYYTQGYVTAYLRLWQMDFFSYATAGRLSEIINSDDIYNFDIDQRRLGLLDAAKKSLEFIKNDQETLNMLTAYTNGINAYIAELTYKKMPFEYKLLDYQPEPWSNLKSVLILKALGNTLSGYEEDMFLSKMILTLGEEKFNLLFPDFIGPITPVMDTAAAISNNSNHHLNSHKVPSYLNYSFLVSVDTVSKSSYNPKLGSNSWAVSGDKTRDGYSILANDPHLNLTLPSFWIEMQLSCHNLNTYGVSIPGTPSIVIGFNNHVAWGITNGADDVKDWYKLKLNDDQKKYLLDSNWLDLSCRVEEFRRRGRNTTYDTVYSSLHGPIVFEKKNGDRGKDYINYALNWELYNVSNEFKTFMRLNNAKNYEDFEDAIRFFKCPTLNFTYIGPGDTIAIKHQGNIRKKKYGQGKFLMDGTKSEHLYDKYLPYDSLPKLLNPKKGFVISANQHPTYSNYEYFYNGYYSETRANQIYANLYNSDNLDVQNMKSFQLDNTNSFAIEAIPLLIERVLLSNLVIYQREAIQELSNWDGAYNFEDKNAILFELWLNKIRDNTWDEFKGPPAMGKTPNDQVLLNLIKSDPKNSYFDIIGTSPKETANEILTQSFLEAFEEHQLLRIKKKDTRWGDLNKINIMHLTNLPAFSIMDLTSSGHPNAINATSGNWGPSWRMIVEIGEKPKAYGVYPGGQSGNIGSKYYKNFVDNWKNGGYYNLQFFASKEEAISSTANRWILVH